MRWGERRWLSKQKPHSLGSRLILRPLHFCPGAICLLWHMSWKRAVDLPKVTVQGHALSGAGTMHLGSRPKQATHHPRCDLEEAPPTLLPFSFSICQLRAGLSWQRQDSENIASSCYLEKGPLFWKWGSPSLSGLETSLAFASCTCTFNDMALWA